MGIMITYHGYNNLMYDAHKTMGGYKTQQNTFFLLLYSIDMISYND